VPTANILWRCNCKEVGLMNQYHLSQQWVCLVLYTGLRQMVCFYLFSDIVWIVINLEHKLLRSYC